MSIMWCCDAAEHTDGSRHSQSCASRVMDNFRSTAPLTFPSHAEPLVREGLRVILESIPLGAPGPLMQVEITPVVMPSPPRFTMDEDDLTPVAADAVGDDNDGA